MQRFSFPWFWVFLAALLLLLPGPAGRLLLDLLGGLTLLVLLLPLLAIGAGLLVWRAIVPRINACPACGTTSFGTDVCPACGTPFSAVPPADRSFTPRSPDVDVVSAGQLTIDVEAVDVPPSTDDGQTGPLSP
jgi:hypothetical protein